MGSARGDLVSGIQSRGTAGQSLGQTALEVKRSCALTYDRILGWARSLGAARAVRVEVLLGCALKLATAALKQSIDDIGILNAAQMNALYQVKDTVELLDGAANGLDHALRDGKGRDETLPRFKRVDSLRRDAEEEGRSADIPEAVFEKIFPVGAALMKLRPYYLEEPQEAPKTE